MSHAKLSRDPLHEILHAPFSRRGLLRTAAAAGMVVPGLGLPVVAGATGDLGDAGR